MSTNQQDDLPTRSFVESATDASGFSIFNLPLCVMVSGEEESEGPAARDEDGEDDSGETEGLEDTHRLGVRIGDQILDVSELWESGHFADDPEIDSVLATFDWAMIASVPDAISRIRTSVRRFLGDQPAGQQIRRLRSKVLVPVSEAKLIAPVHVGNYTDFYASKHHATNVGSMFRPDNPLLPNYTHVPIGYHGRASSIVCSGTPIVRPRGQLSPPDADPSKGPSFAPCAMLDYELELGMYVGKGNALGESVPISRAGEHILGMGIVNDWSARDIQKWEYQPLGPFLAKNFATSISEYIVTLDALAPYRLTGPERGASDPQPLEYLHARENWGLDIVVEAWLTSEKMRSQGVGPQMLSRGNFKHMYWTIAQLLAHHTSNGCNMEPGDLLASGTISGPERSSRGCLLELTWAGPPHLGEDGKPRPRVPIELPTGEKRTFLADGDEVILKAYCQKSGLPTISFGEVRGIVLPARS